jgi:ABC-type sulfate transport system permease component
MLKHTGKRGKFRWISFHVVPVMSSKQIADISSPRHFTSTNYLQAVCLCLHILLVVMHLSLLAIHHTHREHDIIFSLDHQSTVSFWSTFITMAFGTVRLSTLTLFPVAHKKKLRSIIQSFCILPKNWQCTAIYVAITPSLLPMTACHLGLVLVLQFLHFTSKLNCLPLSSWHSQ